MPEQESIVENSYTKLRKNSCENGTFDNSAIASIS